MNRIKARFEKLKAQKRAGLIPFIMAGDPDEETSFRLLSSLPAAGADLIELGIPFSDPMADGITIQLAGQRALAAGTSLQTVLRLVKRFRQGDAETPIILMGYYNPLHAYGIDAFLSDAYAAGVDGLIIVDLPPEEADELFIPARKIGIDLVRLIAPTTGDDRLSYIAKHASGFLYYISVAGVTGAKSADAVALRAKMETIRRHTDLPVAIGFGVKTPEQVAEFSKLCDAVVVGSALVDVIANHVSPGASVSPATDFVRILADATR